MKKTKKLGTINITPLDSLRTKYDFWKTMFFTSLTLVISDIIAFISLQGKYGIDIFALLFAIFTVCFFVSYIRFVLLYNELTI